MEVNFYATLRRVIGGKTLEVKFVEGMTLSQLLQEVVRRFPGLRKELINEDGNLYDHILIFVNGRDASFLTDKLQTRLTPDDVVGIFPPVGGG